MVDYLVIFTHMDIAVGAYSYRNRIDLARIKFHGISRLFWYYVPFLFILCNLYKLKEITQA